LGHYSGGCPNWPICRNQNMTTVIEINTKFDLPQTPRFVSCPGGPETSKEALDHMLDRYSKDRLDLDRVYYAVNDHSFWFALKPRY